MITYEVHYQWKTKTTRKWHSSTNSYESILRAREDFENFSNHGGDAFDEDGYTYGNVQLFKVEELS